ncbi:uncharacterized protein [Epargyreus clarus]|uniref:uncharacterized protein n=1 Tax=Epargyreus clarus TaxID=520877 RepID=UPI003C308A0C
MEQEDRGLAMLLRASRCAGLAPYRSLPNSQISPAFAIYSRFLFFCYGGTTITAIWLYGLQKYRDDLALSHSLAVWVLHAIEGVCVSGIFYNGMYHSPRRMRRTFYYWKRVKTIRRDVGRMPSLDSAQRHAWGLFVWSQLLLTTLYLINIFIFSKNADMLKYLKVAFIYTFLDTAYFVTNIIIAQFVFVAMMINSCFRAINEELEELVSDMLSKDETIHTQNEQLKQYSSMGLKIPMSKINISIDLLGTMIQQREDKKLVHEKLRSLARAYVSTCGLVQQHNSSEEAVLLLLLVYIISNFVSAVCATIWSLTDGESDSTFVLAVDAFWYLQHMCRGMLLAAPPHVMGQEVARTGKLICKIASTVQYSYDPLLAELDVFYTQLMLNQPAYTLLEMFHLRRPLVLNAMAIFTIYLVFQ